MQTIRCFTDLEVLELWNDRISDLSVDSLCSLRHLEVLDVGCTKVTKRGVAELKSRLPQDCSVVGSCIGAD